MNKTIKLLCTWAAGLLLAGCSSEADMSKLMDWQSNPDAVHFTASVNNATTRTNPAATDDAQTKFNENDQVTVSNNGNQADYAYNGKSWVPAIADKYLLWDRSNLTFNCWYPADGKNTATVGYLTADQSTEKLMAKSDYMNAEKTLKTADEALNFNLERKTARIILKISGLIDVPGTIKHVHIVSKASTAAGEKNTIDITPLTQNGEGEIGGIGTTYTALVAPGEVVAKFYFTDDMSDAKPLTMTTNVTAAGSSYIYNLNVGKKKIKVTGIKAGPWTAASGTTTGDLTPIPYITFTAEEEQTFEMRTKYTDPELFPGIEPYKISGLQYSLNNGDWIDVGANGVSVTFGGNNGTLRLRGKNLKGTADDESNYSYISFGTNEVPVTCTGDIRTLLDHESYKTVATDQARFIRLFQNCKAMTTAPNLPAENLANKCYREMFANCTNLVIAPELPAKILADDCYNSMFSGCTKLETAPNLQAKNLTLRCYFTMFRSCKSLETAPELPAKNLAGSCYSFMFYGCTKLITAPELPAKNLASSCYSNMFNGCTKLITAPELPAIKLEKTCYYNMFAGCTSLVSAPKLPATTLAERCYHNMFNGCEKLSSVTMLAPSDQIKKTSQSFNSWLNGAGTSAATRTLKVKNADAYNALAKNTYYLPSNSKWIKGTSGTIVKDENNKDI